MTPFSIGWKANRAKKEKQDKINKFLKFVNDPLIATLYLTLLMLVWWIAFEHFMQ